MDQLEYFWYIHRLKLGFDPNKEMTFKERLYWKKIDIQRKVCNSAKTPAIAIYLAPSFDKQYFLIKWWDKLSVSDKALYLEHVWLNKGEGLLYGYDWWLPYFRDVGFITNCEAEKPTEAITIYRGIEPSFKVGMSWTPYKEVAEHFLESGIDGKKIYVTKVKPESILGIFKGSLAYREKPEEITLVTEYVINHQDLEDEKIEEIQI